MAIASGPWISRDSARMKKLLPIDLMNVGSFSARCVVLEADEAFGVGEVVPLERLRQVVEAVDRGEEHRQDHEAEEQHERGCDEECDLDPLADRARARARPGGRGRTRGKRGPGRVQN